MPPFPNLNPSSRPLPAKVPEILAPAGGRAQFFAALNSGADAVYLGLKAFNARARAENFTSEDLRELVPLARHFGMKILVTVNVLIKEAELPQLLQTLSVLEELEVHAIIVQDLAVGKLARKYFPGLRLHASTQMAVHNLAGVVEAWSHGFRRVVLARELTAREIGDIRAAVPADEMEIEAFCHGSLCYSYSGLCFFSGAGDARSGNRGECAYTCRQPYKILSEPGQGFLFSMRDLDSSQDLARLVESGVDTLKIEGRKKDAQYVSTVVKLYRRGLDEVFGRPTLRPEAPVAAGSTGTEEALRQDLALSFNRNPTTFFLKGRYHENVIDLDNPTHLGLRVGEIRRFGGGRIEVRTEIPLERFDGLKVIPMGRTSETLLQKYQNEVPQFSLQEIWLDGRRVPVAPSGRAVEITWPGELPPPSRGDLLYKARSADLKRRVLKVESPPPDARLKPLSQVEVRIRVDERETELELSVTALKLGSIVAQSSLRAPKEIARGDSRLEADLVSLFGLFGDEGFSATSVTVEGLTEESRWFIPRAHLKELKRKVARELPSAYSLFVRERVAAADAGLAMPRKPTPSGERVFHFKTDRLETAEAISSLLESQSGELVFEPKRAFLPSASPDDILKKLMETGRPLRLAIPTVLRAWDLPFVRKWVERSLDFGIRNFELGNLGALRLLRDWGTSERNLDLSTDFTLYALNSESSRFWAERGFSKITLSVEDDLTNLENHLVRWPWETGARPQAILYKDTPLFIAEACSLTALHNGCPTAKVCGYRTLEIESPAGERFFVAHESCKSIVYGQEAYGITHRRQVLEDLGIRDFRVDFLTRNYSEANLGEIMRAVIGGIKVHKTHPANFERTLL